MGNFRGAVKSRHCHVALDELPEYCIAKILCFTTPPDVCRLACLSSTFKSLAYSDYVWDTFLPSDYQTILSESESESSLTFSSKKNLFFHLSHNHVLVDQGKRSFSLDKLSGKKIYMISSGDLYIAIRAQEELGVGPAISSTITAFPKSRFEKVFELIYANCFEIHGMMINTWELSVNTNYAAYMVFNLRNDAIDFPVQVSLALGRNKICEKSVMINPTIRMAPLILEWNLNGYWHMLQPTDVDRPTQRADGWLEVEIGEFFNKNGTEDQLKISLVQNLVIDAEGVIIEGIEIRPKE